MSTTPHRNPQLYESIGKWLVRLGVFGLIATVIINLIPMARDIDEGALPAIAFLFLMLGLAFLFPDMLQDGSNNLSTMRVIVFMVVCVFVFIAIKVGWTASNYDDFHIDRTWVYILGLAFGSKVFQSFSEGMDEGSGKGDDSADSNPKGGKGGKKDDE